MKSVRYFTLNFSGFTTAACEKQGYLRLIAGDHIFYTDKRYFNDPSLFDHLTINQPPPGVRRSRTTWQITGSTGSVGMLSKGPVSRRRWARPLLIISLLRSSSLLSRS